MAKNKGPQAFYSWYQAQEGERWNGIVEACKQESTHFTLDAHLEKPYFLDEASVVAARWVEPKPGDRIVDLCAAPGGKSLCIMSKALEDGIAESLDMVVNELSIPRRERLKKVINEHLPPQIAASVKIFGHDAGRWGQFRPESAEWVLLDAPCSSERHLIQDPSYLEDWSPGRSSRLAQQSYAMLLSAFQTLVTGGSVVYATCAIAQGENDGVIARVLERLQSKVEVNGYSGVLALPNTAEEPALVPSWAEATEFGIRIMPDTSGGHGPLYISRLTKVPGPV